MQLLELLGSGERVLGFGVDHLISWFYKQKLRFRA